MAEKAKLEMQTLKADNEKLLQEARVERDRILKEASEASNQMIEAAKTKANEEGDRMIANAREAGRQRKTCCHCRRSKTWLVTFPLKLPSNC